MNRLGRAAIMAGLGIFMARLLWSGGFGWFVQQRMRLPLVGAAVVLLVFGLYEAVVGSRSTPPESDHDHDDDHAGHDHRAGPAVGWLMMLPLVVLISVAPTALGAAAADRVEAFTPEISDDFPPLDSSAGPPELRVFEFLERAIWDEERSLEGTTVRLEGLVVNDPSLPDGFKLTRFMVSCCAADGIPLQVAVHGTGPALPDDTWVVVDLVWRPPATPYAETPGQWIIEADAVGVTISDAPNDPYESPY